jgi:hypothetical protein
MKPIWIEEQMRELVTREGIGIKLPHGNLTFPKYTRVTPIELNGFAVMPVRLEIKIEDLQIGPEITSFTLVARRELSLNSKATGR